MSRSQTTAVGSFKPNAWGLYDMHGNVKQWCADFHGTLKDDATDPTGPKPGADDGTLKRILRGGSWDIPPQVCRSAWRSAGTPDATNHNIGFRVVLDGAAFHT